MMKLSQLIALSIILLATQKVDAQTASVRLTDGAGTVISTHNSIGTAYAAITTPMTAAHIIEMLPAYTGVDEILPLTLTDKAGASATNTITIRPATGVTAVNFTANVAAVGLITLDNANWLIIDGRAGGVGNTRVWTLNSTATNANTISLINGSSNNIIRYLVLENGGFSGASRCVQIGTSATNPQGNSFNTIEHCLLIGSRYGVNINGTAANPNRKNIIRKNEISTVVFTGIWLQGGTSGVTIDSNLIFSTNTAGAGPFGILFDSQTDTAIIRNNHIYDINGGTSTASIRGIAIRSTLAAGTDNYSEIYNNFISINLPNSSSINMIGIEYAGVNLINAKVYHNTVLIGGSLSSGGLATNILSAAFSKAPAASNVASNFDIRNNIFLNTRTGGVGGAQHLALALANTAGSYSLDYNTYGSAAGLGRVGTSVENTFSAFVAALGTGNEVNGNTEPVTTVSLTDLRLSGSSLGNQNLGASFISSVPTDILNNPRSIVTTYRGAHEAIPSLGSNCTGTPSVGVASANSLNLCTGDSLILSLSIAIDSNLLYQWQSAPIGSTNFVDITGATTAPFLSLALSPLQYRCIALCPVSNERDTSNVLTTVLTPTLAGLSIQSSAAGATYTFTANANPSAVSFLWNFDDGVTDTGRVVTHTFTANRLHIVRMVAQNSCFEDSAALALNIINASVSENSWSAETKLYPNPANAWLTLSTGFYAQKISILNAMGAVVASHEIEPSNEHQIELKELPVGMYYARITGTKGELAVKSFQVLR